MPPMPTAGPPMHLRCEFFVNPLAIDAARPRLSWQLSDSRHGARQTAYHIVVDGLWDSGEVQSDQATHIVYDGPPLKSRQRCAWKVRTWDADGQASSWSEPATWEMGLLDRADWSAKWIGSDIVGGPYTIPPAPHLRKAFALDRPVASARLYVTALGLHACEINGKPVSADIFVPGRTDYAKRVPYHVYDVTPLLVQGPNAIGAVLGDGWYCGHLHSDPRMTYGDRPRLLAQLEVTFADGSMQMIATDETWTAGEGPIRSSDMLMGEDYDARMEIPGWSAPFPSRDTAGEGQGEGSRSPHDPTARASRAEPSPHPSSGVPGEGVRAAALAPWRPVVVFPDPDLEIVAHRAPPVRRQREIRPVAPPAQSANRRRHIFDLGQNIVGRIRLRIRNARPGQTIDLRYTEMLDREGKPYTLALRTARATDHYTTRGGEEEIYEPHFTFHGFRYVEVRDYPGRNPTVDDLTGIVIHSDCESTGEFECSDPRVNQLQSNITWSQRGNFLDIPTDCPQRDERLGWTGDAQVFIRTAAFNMDVANFFAKWLQDVADAQFEDGHVPSVVPHVSSLHHEGGPAWADAVIICPWWLYQCYGDTRVLEERWPNMSRFMQWMKQSYPDFIRPAEIAKWKGYGDWLAINAVTPPEFIGTSFFAYCARLMGDMARAIGRSNEARQYDELFAAVRDAWRRRFVAPDGAVAVSTQTAYVLALHFDLLDEAHRPAAVDALVRDIESRGMHLSTGFVGTPYLNPVLTRFHRSDIAYALLQQRTFPSWLYPVTQGATTMWERWDAWTHDKGFSDTGMNSFNHYAFGAVGEWLYAAVAGIDLDPAKPGYKHILIRPQPGGALSWAKGSLRTMHGLIESAWRIEQATFSLELTIPANTTATVYLPAADAQRIQESQTPAPWATGVRLIDFREGVAVLEVPAGRYALTAPLRPR